jgi:hypothetical protein
MMADCLVRGMNDGSIDPDITLRDALIYMKACISGTLGMAVFTSQYLQSELGMEPMEVFRRNFDFALRAFKKNSQE